ncbi:hypothetical protein CC86DRAFT_9907 [Ophiobolus disseminans]|uniref:Uncharacterized protein n=1 Tax=Ophiobolus disseminans TaxID=1469910 RepID=A0A6A7AK13_9PLEO|nr:hypothetical protein CC86DRAFT_9907 [Ophiobolus disseminans]
MYILDNVRSDLRLRNLTVYAQWTSVFGALLLYFAAIPRLLSIFSILISGYNNRSSRRIVPYLVDLGVMTILFPLAPLALDLPHYFRRQSLIYISMLSWFVMPIRHFVPSMSKFDGHPFAGFVHVLPFSLAFFFAINITMTRIYWKRGPGLRTRFGVNLVLCSQITVYACGFGFPRVRIVPYAISAGMFGIAALLYGIAWMLRHPWVSSRLLGGTGIVPMVLMLPGRGPLYRSVGNEAREGPIHLV